MRLIQFTDLHLFANREADLYGGVPDTMLRRVLAAIEAVDPAPEHLFITGDLTHDDAAPAYRRVNDYVNELGKPTYWVPGNHDDREVMAECLNGCLDPERNVRLGAWRLILLDSQWTGEIPGDLSAAELEFLQQSLASCAEEGNHALIAVHHPPFKLGSRWIDNYRLLNDDAFWEVADQFDCVRAVVSGHVHQEADLERNGVRLLTTPATSMQFMAGTVDPEIDTVSLPGYRIFDLADDGTFATEVVRVE